MGSKIAEMAGDTGHCLGNGCMAIAVTLGHALRGPSEDYFINCVIPFRIFLSARVGLGRLVLRIAPWVFKAFCLGP